MKEIIPYIKKQSTRFQNIAMNSYPDYVLTSVEKYLLDERGFTPRMVGRERILTPAFEGVLDLENRQQVVFFHGGIASLACLSLEGNELEALVLGVGSKQHAEDSRDKDYIFENSFGSFTLTANGLSTFYFKPEKTLINHTGWFNLYSREGDLWLKNLDDIAIASRVKEHFLVLSDRKGFDITNVDYQHLFSVTMIGILAYRKMMQKEVS